MRELLLEAEVILNNRPLGYLEDDIQLPPLTPNMLIHGTNVTIPEEILDDDPEYRQPLPARMARHLQKCKDVLWKRWNTEYLRALRERHQCCSSGINPKLDVGDIVQVKDDFKNRGEWKIGVVVRLVKHADVILGAKLKMGNNNIIERPVQHLYPLELHVDPVDENRFLKEQVIENEEEKDDPKARPGRKAKIDAISKIRNIGDYLDKDAFI